MGGGGGRGGEGEVEKEKEEGKERSGEGERVRVRHDKDQSEPATYIHATITLDKISPWNVHPCILYYAHNTQHTTSLYIPAKFTRYGYVYVCTYVCTAMYCTIHYTDQHT